MNHPRMDSSVSSPDDGAFGADLPANVDAEALITKAFALHNQGRLEDAYELYGQALSLSPTHFSARKLRATVAMQLARHEEAVAVFDDLILLNPFDAGILNNRGSALHQLRELERAKVSLERALEIDPLLPAAHGNLGRLLIDLGEPDAGLNSLSHALKLNPEDTGIQLDRVRLLIAMQLPSEALRAAEAALVRVPQNFDLNLARLNLLLELGFEDFVVGEITRLTAANEIRWEYCEIICRILLDKEMSDLAHGSLEGLPLTDADKSNIFLRCADALSAEKKYLKALSAAQASERYAPTCTAGRLSHANILIWLKRFEEALQQLDLVSICDADREDILNARAFAHFELKQFTQAIEITDTIIKKYPRIAGVHNLRAHACRELGRYEEAEHSARRAIDLNPDFAEAFNNLSCIQFHLKRPAEALSSIDTALQLDPNSADAHGNRGSALLALNRVLEAIVEYRTAQRLAPDFSLAHFHEGICHLLLGDYERGWQKYEYRWQTQSPQFAKKFSFGDAWDGSENLRGKTILLYPEQGLGDTVQFLRFAASVVELGAHVSLLVPKCLSALAMSMHGVRVIAEGEPVTQHDFHCALMSLPLHLGVDVENIDGGPYLSAPESHMQKWRIFFKKNNRKKIGVVWSGNPDHGNDANRSISLNLFKDLMIADCDFVCLQREVRPCDCDSLREQKNLLDLREDIFDLADTASIVTQLDLVISVDTCVAHIAGALGKEVWILLPNAPDWRWMLQTSSTPWYSSARLFRQSSHGDWGGILNAVKISLKKFVDHKS